MSGFHQFQNVYGRSPPSSNPGFRSGDFMQNQDSMSNPGFRSGDFMQNQDSMSNQLLLSKEFFLSVKKFNFSYFKFLNLQLNRQKK